MPFAGTEVLPDFCLRNFFKQVQTGGVRQRVLVAHLLARQDPLHRHLHLLAVDSVWDVLDREDEGRDVSCRQASADSPLQPRHERRAQCDGVHQLEEEQHSLLGAVGAGLAHTNAVAHLGELLDDVVNLRRAEPHAARVQSYKFVQLA